MFAITRRPSGVVHLTVDREVRGRPGIELHYSPLSPQDIRTHQRIPITSPARTLLDLGATLPVDELERAAAEAWAKRLVRRSDLQAQVDRNPNRPGTPALRALLELERDPARTRSKAERRLLTLVRTAGLPEPETNAYIGPHEVDCLWRAEKLVVEFDSWSFHSSRKAFENDRRRDADLLARGYRVLRITWRRLIREPDAVIALLSRALGVSSH
jgi:very-short-patch-repair endonuclease